jgi:poly(A) polymerase
MTALARDGRPARYVGGCVRDALIDPAAPGTDIDVATPERPERVMKLLAQAGLKPIPTGLRHGTVSLQFRGRRFEITTLRRDIACDGRHAEVEFTDDFAADAARRDFTINAMSCDADGLLHDPMGGAMDLAAGRVRFVGDPRRRIAEDYLRILRFFRFQARFGRGEPDAAALAACAELATGIDRLSGERIRQELWLILVGPRPDATLALMRSAGVLERVVQVPLAQVALEHLGDRNPLLRLAALIRPSDVERVEAVAERLRLSNDERNRLRRLAVMPMPDVGGDPVAQRLALHRLGRATFVDLVRLARASGAIDGAAADRALALAAAWRAPDFPLQGDDLLALGVLPGPALGRMLAEVRAAWEASDFTLDRAACLTRARELATRP